ncbi:carbohydrate ABC transporter substrate-binding protein (CUT1 family) [Muricomes intestini]|jgi:multiple sugar transport system substrate-binding protein|uniref:Carbohydrate ABC transporter substrate-binding protein (CUT1 family) n=1 Tax=Muricomes intestini TaxID=1796634 RepID=A0A4R3K3B1_9FIRM|nr:sugar ABC transporter substrate-binding protein [Muricomes intestini]TCS77184.1 carbohydrate ABC transporter substrate-binding protein (CUT1 family) [Muricomes intestini]
MKRETFVKKSLSVVLTGAMVLGLVACGGGSGGETKDDSGSKSVALKWQQWWAVECPEGYVQNIVDKYEEKTGVKIELLSAPFADTKTQITSGASTGTVADIVGVDSSWVYDFAKQGILTNQSKLMDDDGFNQEIVDSEWQVDSSTYAVPVVNFAYPMYANQDILDKAGVTELPNTWSEFENACQKIKDAGYYPFALNLDTTSPSGIQNSYMGFAWASGIKMKDDAGNCKLTGNEELKEFAEFMKGLYDKGYIYPGMSALTEADMSSKFCSGEIAFHINSAALLTSYRKEAPDMHITAAPIPIKDDYTGKRGMCVASWALGVTEKSENKAEAMKFIEYLLSGLEGREGSICADLAMTQSAFPNSTLAEPDYSNADEVFQDIYDMYQKGYPINEFTGMKEANTIMTDYINELVPYMDGEQDTTAFLENVQKSIDDIYDN